MLTGNRIFQFELELIVNFCGFDLFGRFSVTVMDFIGHSLLRHIDLQGLM